jgi:bifunctional non-homologous end joining protein LigD
MAASSVGSPEDGSSFAAMIEIGTHLLQVTLDTDRNPPSVSEEGRCQDLNVSKATPFVHRGSPGRAHGYGPPVPGKLDPYRKKRDFGRTPEPAPKKTARSRARRPRFVVQEHHARALHWDLRLEHEGVLASWALPKGVPLDPARNHLAVRTEDHPLEYASFEGEIPKGQYGAGTVTIWDRGTYEPEKWKADEVIAVLEGERVQGRYALFRTRGERDWMIHRMDPAPADREPLPKKLTPMLATAASELPPGSGWAYELKWDGARALLFVQEGKVRALSRNGRDVTASYPELHPLGEQAGARELLLDGEIVAFDEHGRPSFARLQRRMHVTDTARARRLAKDFPVTYLAFDLLHLDGRPLLSEPYRERRRLLEELELSGPAWQVPDYFGEEGEAVLKASKALGLEGVVCKRLDSRYLPGKRSSDWLKVKHSRTQEVVVGGWRQGQGRRAGTIGSLLVGVNREEGLAYVGRVGSGFDEAALGELSKRLAKLERKISPFAGELPRAETGDAHWVSPELVGEVSYTEWTPDERLRHPVWRGLRPDKSPEEVWREP